VYTLDDTIAAIATPPGEGGIGVIKISGPEALSLLTLLFRPVPDTSNGRQPIPRHLHYGYVLDPASGEKVDEVLAAYMPAPHSYTRQDVVELQAHGGVVPLRRILELALRHGARLAYPGEMTLRAFLNGRLDLAQAEAVLDVVRAKTAASLRLAVEQLGGRLSAHIAALRRELVHILAYLEASIDFVEDEIPFQDIVPPLLTTLEGLDRLLASAGQGMIYRQGLHAAIVGRPNVGKSSLLNALLETDRAIVTPIPGTTRDTLEESIDLAGVPLVLIDTAGMAPDTEDFIERLGVERSRRALEQADLALLVVDGSEPLKREDRELAQVLAALSQTQPGGKRAIVVVNKLDLPQATLPDSFLPEVRRVYLSALSGEGLEELKTAILDLVWSGQVLASDALLVNNPRHQAALALARQHVADAHRAHLAGATADLVAIDLRAAVDTLGEITGESVSADLLEIIFSEFCVGK
jgi:tRNA modification GTPase